MDPPGGKKAIRPRRTHRKSRLGCTNCKRRRIKCDEKWPSCSNCSNHDVECTFMTVATQSAESSAQEDLEVPTRKSARRFQPHQFEAGGLQQTFRISKPHPQSSSSSTHSTGTQCDILKESPQSTISIADLQLFHHWSISAFRTMRNSDPHNVWQYHIVQWGIEFPSILHLILALSALHLAFERPDERNKYIQKADDHFTFGVRTVTNLLSLEDLDEGNCQKIYMSAVLIIFIYFGRGPRPGEYLIFSDTGPAEWLVLMQGVKLTVQSHHQKVFSGILKPEPPEPLPAISPSMALELHEQTVYTQAAQRLVEREVTDESVLPLYISALDDLYDIMNQVYQRRSAQQTGVALMDLLIGWLYRLPEQFIRLLEEKEPRALVVLAYWAVMFRYMETAWFMKGWAAHVLSGVSTFIQAEYRPWIEWPLNKVREVASE
ncbi:unnamed protein product [Penicillium manginii]